MGLWFLGQLSASRGESLESLFHFHWYLRLELEGLPISNGYGGSIISSPYPQQPEEEHLITPYPASADIITTLKLD